MFVAHFYDDRTSSSWRWDILSWNVLVREMYGIKVSRASSLETFSRECNRTGELSSIEKEKRKREKERGKERNERKAYIVYSNINLISWISRHRAFCTKRNDSVPWQSYLSFLHTCSAFTLCCAWSALDHVIKINFAISFV